jgi:hypothetical protein
MPVFQPAPMRRWSPIVVFKEMPTPPLAIPSFLTTSTEIPYSGQAHPFPQWFHTWK